LAGLCNRELPLYLFPFVCFVRMDEAHHAAFMTKIASGQVTDVCLAHCRLVEWPKPFWESFEAACCSPAARQSIVKLDLSHNDLDDTEVFASFISRIVAAQLNLSTLNLAGCGGLSSSRHACVFDLVTGGAGRRLTKLDISKTNLSADVAFDLLRALGKSHQILRELNFGNGNAWSWAKLQNGAWTSRHLDLLSEIVSNSFTLVDLTIPPCTSGNWTSYNNVFATFRRNRKLFPLRSRLKYICFLCVFLF
jgi:hypothetical protein